MSEILFISDLHLAPERPDIIQLYLKFLHEQARFAKRLYILGDFVEYWLGDDDRAQELEPVFAKMKQLADAGLKIYLMHGNRDFLMGEAFAERCGCTLISDPTVDNLNQHSALLMHGDTLCTDDVRYQELRVMLRNPQWQQDFLAKPLAERELMAKALREQSKEETQAKQAEIMDVNADAVAQAFIEHDVSLMIHGHTHRPAIHSLQVNGQPVIRIVLGDWYETGSYLAFDADGQYQLKEYA
ncbi:MAG: UDP-2,3-diacylglucosamine diphosphatase [Gammaproteobacteria bacterium]